MEPYFSAYRHPVAGVPVDSVPPALALRLLFTEEPDGRPAVILTPNTAMAADLLKHPDRIALFRQADLCLPDGRGIALLAKRAGVALPAPTAGIDFADLLLHTAAARGERVYFLGGAPGIAQAAADRCRARIPSLQIAGCHDGYFDHAPNSPDNRRILRAIGESRASVLLVCLGYPLQEEWMLKNRDCLPTLRLCIGLGGSFDVWAGKLRRAPCLLQRLGLEWLWRIALEPRRFGRVIGMFGAFPTLLRQSAVEKRMREPVIYRQNAQKPDVLEGKKSAINQSCEK